MAVEAVMAALLLVAVVVFVLATDGSDDSAVEGGSSELEAMTADALRVMAATDGNATRRSPLATLVADGLHGRTTELENRTERLLPGGAEAGVHLGNGAGETVLLDGGPVPDEAVEARQPIAPTWPTVHIVPEFRVYPADAEATMNVTALPLWGSTPLDRSDLDGENISYGNGFEATLDDGEAAPGTLTSTGIENASADGGDGFPTDSEVETLESNTTYRDETLEGTAEYRTDDADVVEEAHDPAAANLSEASLGASPGDLAVGETVNVSWNLDPVSSAVEPHTTADGDPEVHLALFRPVARDEPALPNETAAYHFRNRSTDGFAEVSLDRGEILGRWMAVAQLNYTLDTASGSLNQSVRLVETFTVRMAGTSGDPTALYDLEVVAWYEGW